MKDSSQIVKELLRVGTVTVKDPENMCCRVTFSDTPTNAVTSYWLPVLVTRAHGDTYYDLPDIGSKVLCAFLPNGHEEGFILGSYYPKGKAPETDGDIYCHAFKDGTYIEYNRKEHRLIASCVCDVNLSAQGTLNLRAENINMAAGSVINIQAPQVKVQE
ncbi:phage baseplate assembly protein V [Taurinivorans muris]|uniref:Phage baseplate assembly protein V n=1 Tax=Taurinivorans muris TaxID=2787751 RepID=A0ABY5Y4E3_9BACT|nr:phage baseplate assembly protein V [Desulfovibrionaceae bacterium LT0009]